MSSRRVLWAILFFACLTFRAQAAQPVAVAEITGIYREVLVSHPAGHAAVKGSVKKSLYEGDAVETGTGCQCVLLFGDGSEVKLEQNSRLLIQSYGNVKRNLVVELGRAYCRFKLQQMKTTVETPGGVMGIEGTELDVSCPDKTQMQVNVVEGHVRVAPEATKLSNGETVAAGSQSLVGKSAPAKVTRTTAAVAPWEKDVYSYVEDVEKSLDTVKKPGRPSDAKARLERHMLVVAPTDFHSHAQIEVLLRQRAAGSEVERSKLIAVESSYSTYKQQWRVEQFQFRQNYSAAYPVKSVESAGDFSASGKHTDSRNQRLGLGASCESTIQLQVRGASVSGTMTVVISSKTAGENTYNFQVTGTYDGQHQTLRGTLQGSGMSGSFDGKRSGKTLSGSLTVDNEPGATKTWGWSAEIDR